MIAISISVEAYVAIKVSLPGHSIRCCPRLDGFIRIWLGRKVVDKLARMRASGETYSDVILPLAKE